MESGAVASGNAPFLFLWKLNLLPNPTLFPSMTVVTKEPLQINDKCQVKWRNGDTLLNAVVIERRPVGHRKRKKTLDLSTLSAKEIEYYVHYLQHDR